MGPQNRPKYNYDDDHDLFFKRDLRFKKITTLTTFGPQELSLSVSEPKFCEEAV